MLVDSLLIQPLKKTRLFPLCVPAFCGKFREEDNEGRGGVKTSCGVNSPEETVVAVNGEVVYSEVAEDGVDMSEMAESVEDNVGDDVSYSRDLNQCDTLDAKMNKSSIA